MKFGAIVVDGRNKIGGHVASKNRAGAYLRTKVTPVNPRTESQLDARSRLSNQAQAWRGLTQAQRNSWNNAVNDYKKTDIFGDIKVPSGFNLFVKLNSNLALIGEASLTDAPAPVSVPSVTSFALTAIGSTHALTGDIAPDTNPAGNTLLAKATSQISAGKNFVKSEYRVISVEVTNTSGAIVLTTAYTAKFGAISQVGSKVFVELYYINQVTGQSSKPFSASAVIV